MKIASPLGEGGLQGGFEHGNEPTPALRDGVKPSQDFTFEPRLRRKGFSRGGIPLAINRLVNWQSELA